MSRENITTNFASIGNWNKEVEKYEKGEDFDVYARYNYPDLIKREKEFAEMIGVPDTALFNAGMAAIDTAVEAESLKPGDIVICGKDVYDETKEIYKILEERGVEVVEVDSGNMEEIEKTVKKKKPRLIILESIANAQNMQVCDIKRLGKIVEEANNKYGENFNGIKLVENYLSKRSDLFGKASLETKESILKNIDEFKKGGNQFIFRDSVRRLEKEVGLNRQESIRELARLVKYVINNSREKLSLIIDNTLASPVLYNPANDLKESGVEAVIVESGTKHYQKGQDKITMGIVYSNDKKKIKKIKDMRYVIGTYLQPNDEKEIPNDITKVMPEILKRHAKNALKLAELINSSGKAVEVSHPNLPEHKQSELTKEIAPEGLVTVFYIKMENASVFVNKVKELGEGKIGIGASFGHAKTWIYNFGDQIRIAAGSETEKEFEEIMNIFKNALEKYE